MCIRDRYISSDDDSDDSDDDFEQIGADEHDEDANKAGSPEGERESSNESEIVMQMLFTKGGAN